MVTRYLRDVEWDWLRNVWDVPALRATMIVAGSVIIAKLAELVLRKTIGALAERTTSTLDDVVVASIRRPVFLTVVLFGLAWATRELPIKPRFMFVIDGTLETFAVLIWTAAAFRIGIAVLEALSRRSSETSVVQPRTMPIFEMLMKLAVIGTAIYFMFLAWRIDLTAWLASAGIIGIAVGFAAKDTLANLFSGIFIVADAPYKLGDVIVLEGGMRGQVTKIGIRSTRVLTMDDVEITVPNALLGNSKIINETGGPYVKQRVGVSVDVAYGSDIDHVREVLLRCPVGVKYISEHPKPQVRLKELGASGLKVDLLVWLDDAPMRLYVIDALNTAIYKSFAKEGIEIPYTRYDVHIVRPPGT